MNAARELVSNHYASLIAEGQHRGFDQDLLGRLLLDAIIAGWRESRTLVDIASELDFVRTNLDPDAEHVFMRP